MFGIDQVKAQEIKNAQIRQIIAMIMFALSLIFLCDALIAGEVFIIGAACVCILGSATIIGIESENIRDMEKNW